MAGKKKKKDIASKKKKILDGLIQLGVIILVDLILSLLSIRSNKLTANEYNRNFLWMFGVWFYVTIILVWLIQQVVKWVRKRDNSIDAKTKKVVEEKKKCQKALSAAGNGVKWILYIVGLYFLVMFMIMAVTFSLLGVNHP